MTVSQAFLDLADRQLSAPRKARMRAAEQRAQTGEPTTRTMAPVERISAIMTSTLENPPFHIVLANRLFAIWEKYEALAAQSYSVGDDWVEGRPTTAPSTLNKMAEDTLEVACELAAMARDVAADDKRHAESTAALQKSYVEVLSKIERDQLTQRLGEIVRSQHKPPEPTL
jgi:hypothetical protein